MAAVKVLKKWGFLVVRSPWGWGSELVLVKDVSSKHRSPWLGQTQYEKVQPKFLLCTPEKCLSSLLGRENLGTRGRLVSRALDLEVAWDLWFCCCGQAGMNKHQRWARVPIMQQRYQDRWTRGFRSSPKQKKPLGKVLSKSESWSTLGPCCWTMVLTHMAQKAHWCLQTLRGASWGHQEGAAQRHRSKGDQRHGCDHGEGWQSQRGWDLPGNPDYSNMGFHLLVLLAGTGVAWGKKQPQQLANVTDGI